MNAKIRPHNIPKEKTDFWEREHDASLRQRSEEAYCEYAQKPIYKMAKYAGEE